MKNSFAAVILMSTIASAAWCAPPLASDDASSLPPGMCQLEIEQRQFHNRVERDVMPVCNIWFDAEIGIGHQRVAVRDAPRADSIVYQLKKVFTTADASEWAFGIGAATVRAVNTSEKSGTRQHYINALLSRQFGAMALHANLGGVVDREAEPGTRRNRLTWALAAEYETTLRWTLVGEVLGQRGQPATAQVGLRWWALPKYVQFTTSLGAQRGSGRDGRWMSFGIRFETGDPVIW